MSVRSDAAPPATPDLFLQALLETPAIVLRLEKTDVPNLAAASSGTLNAVLKAARAKFEVQVAHGPTDAMLGLLAEHVAPGSSAYASRIEVTGLLEVGAHQARALRDATVLRQDAEATIELDFATPLHRIFETAVLLELSKETERGLLLADTLHMCGNTGSDAAKARAAMEGESTGKATRELLGHDGARALRRLEICCWDDLTHIAAGLKAVPTMKEFSLLRCGGGCEAQLAAGLEHLSLQGFFMEACNVDGRGMELLAGGLRSSQHMTHLLLNTNPLGDRGARALAGALGALPHLYSLEATHCDMCPEGVSELAGAVARHKTLVSLSLGLNCFGTEGLRAVCTAVERCKTLKHLFIGKACIGSREHASIMARIVNAGNLRSLAFYLNPFNDDSSNVIAKAVLKNRTLTMLDIPGTGVGDKTAAEYAQVIRTHPALETLSLMGNAITDVGARALAAGLKQVGSTRLRKLVLTQNPVTIAGAVALGRAQGENPALADMEVSMSGPDEAGGGGE